VQYNVRAYRPVHVFDSTTLGLQLESSQVVTVLVVGPVQLFPFPWFSGGCVFSSCWLRSVVALCFRGLSPCVLLCNLQTYVSLTAPTAWSTDIYRVIHMSLRDFRPLRYSIRDGHAEGEHVNRGRDTPSFCPASAIPGSLDLLTSEGY